MRQVLTEVTRGAERVDGRYHVSSSRRNRRSSTMTHGLSMYTCVRQFSPLAYEGARLAVLRRPR